MGNTNTRRGFTLIELLIVVLIIGVLTAIAVPQYQKAVMKSRFSALMPIAKSIANGNEVYYMEHGTYASNPTSLDVAGKDEKYPDGTELDMSTGEYSFVLAGRDNNFPMNYIVYQMHSGKFADNIHCEADENNNMAKEICQSLGGQLINGSQTDGFLTYVLSGNVGSEDKLPTSMTKLKKQICGTQFDDDHCIVDEVAQTVTTKECGDSISYNANGVQTTGAGCVTTTYGADGTPKGQAATTCNATLATYADGKCTPKKWNDSNPYETTYNADGSLAVSKYCHQYVSSGCIYAGVRRYNGDGSYTSISGYCSGNATPNLDTAICPEGKQIGLYKYSFDEYGNQTEYYACGQVDYTTGTCKTYSQGAETINIYDNNNRRIGWNSSVCTEWTGTHCTGKWVVSTVAASSSNVWHYIQCYGGSSNVDASGNCATHWYHTADNSSGSTTCTNGVNWETATCL